jgi:uncharacterized protein
MRKRRFISSLLLVTTIIFSNSINQVYGRNMKNDLERSNGYDVELQQKITAAYESKGKDYVPRTQHLNKDGAPSFTNRLILEDSPYLLQHAHNPVNWYPWAKEAFLIAEKENKPIFLSIGYSTCHWCHVMEHESFENIEIANFLNTHFISIKVDRELRPDLDHLYMTAVMILNRQGGWPMSSFLIPDGKPFFGGTYYPPQMFLELLQKIHEAWGEKQSDISAQAVKISGMVQKIMASETLATEIGEKSIATAVNNLVDSHDQSKGGFGKAPKFPHEASLLLLLENLLHDFNSETLEVVNTTLMSMARGGIYDQIGGGFHRYSVDENWLVPHFEKMLYNQANLVQVYIKAYQLTNNQYYALIAKETLEYVLRDMTSKEGGFFSATDADSEGVEGMFFLWEKRQLQQVLTQEEADLVIDYYSVTANGNFEKRNLLHIPEDPFRFAENHQMSISQLFNQLEKIKRKLYVIREQKNHPLRDEKIITAWNGMMIIALASAADILGDNKYQQAAIKTANFLWEKSRSQKGILYRSHLSGVSSTKATLEDYAYFSRALIELYDLTGELVWLSRSVELTDEMISLFRDQTFGGFFMNNTQTEVKLMARPKEGNDGATPSGNSMALDVLVMLHKRTSNESYLKNANSVLAAFSSKISQYPEGFAYMLLGASKLFLGEYRNNQYTTGGAVNIKMKIDPIKDKKTKFKIEFTIKPDWHINSNRPLQENLIPTQVSLKNSAKAKITNIIYPKSETVSLGFQEGDLSVYSGDKTVTGDIEFTSNKASPDRLLMHLQVSFQACNDSFCALPEVLSFPILLNH